MDTKQLRQHIRQQRRELDIQSRNEAVLQLCERIANNKLFKQSQHIAMYLPNDGEMDLRLLIEHAWEQNKTCYLPVLAEPNVKRLWFIPYYPDSKLRNNKFGIPEPVHPRKMRMRKTLTLDLILMPLVAFDPQGNRIGMGGGFYDRTLAFLRTRQHWHKPNLVGVAYEFQKIAKISCNPWDIPLQAIATENNIYLAGQ